MEVRAAPQGRLDPWLDLFTRLFEQPLTCLPVDELNTTLQVTLEAQTSSWNWRDPTGLPQVRVGPTSSVMPDDRIREWMASPAFDDHPLLRWYAASGSSAPQTIGRVPPVVAGARSVSAFRELADPYGLTEQLSVPLVLTQRTHEAFVLTRESGDFTDEDVRLATRLQPALVGLYRQVRTLARWRLEAAERTRDGTGLDGTLGESRLTGRELSILYLLAQGLTAVAMGHRLGVSPRTVHKHLEHVYAKLHVTDRVTAVIRAQQHGLLPRTN